MISWAGRASVFFSSPGHPHTTEFLKDHRYTYILPTWSLVGFQIFNALRGAKALATDTLEQLHDQRGGVPRLIFSTSQDSFETMLAEPLQSFDLHRGSDTWRAAQCRRSVRPLAGNGADESSLRGGPQPALRVEACRHPGRSAYESLKSTAPCLL